MNSSSSVAGGYENFFFSLKDPVRVAYTTLDSSVLVFGVFFNATLLHLIRTKTVSAMRTYSKILAVSCAMDLVASVSTFLVQPIPVPDYGFRAVILNGVFRHSSRAVRFAAWLFWIQVDLFFLITTMCQYVCRYCILCRGAISGAMFAKILCCCAVLYVGHGALEMWADFPHEEDEPRMEELAAKIHADTGITDIKFSSYVWARDYRYLSHNAMMGVIVPSFYVVIFLCSRKIRRAINEMNVLKLREYNNQVSAVLLFQALLPTLQLLSWNLQMYVPALFIESNTVWPIVFTDVPIHLLPVINALGTIWLVRPYRRACFEWLGIRNDSLTRLITGTGTGAVVSSNVLPLAPLDLGQQQPM